MWGSGTDIQYNLSAWTSAPSYSVHPQGKTGLHCLQINVNNQENLLLVKALGKDPFIMLLAERHMLNWTVQPGAWGNLYLCIIWVYLFSLFPFSALIGHFISYVLKGTYFLATKNIIILVLCLPLHQRLNNQKLFNQINILVFSKYFADKLLNLQRKHTTCLYSYVCSIQG